MCNAQQLFESSVKLAPISCGRRILENYSQYDVFAHADGDLEALYIHYTAIIVPVASAYCR